MPSVTRRSAASCAVGQQHDDVALRVGRALQHRGERAGGAGAGGTLGRGQHAGAPVVVGGREVVRAHDDHGAALGQVGAELGGAGEDVAAVGDLALEERGQEGGLRGLGGAVGRAQALDLAGDHRRRDPQDRRGGAAAARAQAQAADDRVAHAQLVRLHALGVAHQRALVRRRARGDREHGARAIDQHQRRIERTRRRPDDFGEPETGLHRVRHRTERAEVGQRRLFAGGRGHGLKVRRREAEGVRRGDECWSVRGGVGRAAAPARCSSSPRSGRGSTGRRGRARSAAWPRARDLACSSCSSTCRAGGARPDGSSAPSRRAPSPAGSQASGARARTARAVDHSRSEKYHSTAAPTPAPASTNAAST